MVMAEHRQPDFKVLTGHAEFSARVLYMVADARQTLDLLTQTLDERIYATPAFVTAISKFVRQHAHTRFRILVGLPRQAVVGGGRFVELARTLSSFIEFRELPHERRLLVLEEYLIADDRRILYRETPEDLEAKYSEAPHPLPWLKHKDFEHLWNESTPAQELRRLSL